MDKEVAKLLKINDPFLVSLLSKCNPFCLTMEDGKSHFFNTETDAYFYVMIQVWNNAKKGYVELPYILTFLYKHLTLKDTKEIARKLYPWFNNEDRECMLVDWSGKEGYKFFYALCSSLCSLTLTSFNSFYLDEAYKLFKRRWDIENLKQEILR